MKTKLISYLILVVLIAYWPKYIFAQAKDQESKKNQKQTANLHLHVSGLKADSLVESANIDLVSEEPGLSFSKSIITNNKGVGSISNVPQGKILIQITAKGWETYGEHFVLDGSEKSINILLKPSIKKP